MVYANESAADKLEALSATANPDEFIRFLEDVSLDNFNIDAETWADLMVWCKANPDVAYVNRTCFNFTITRSGFQFVCATNIRVNMDLKNYPRDATIKFPASKNLADTSQYRFCGTMEELDKMVINFAQEKNLRSELGKVLGYEIGDDWEEELITGRNILTGIYVDYYADRIEGYNRKVSTTPFRIHAPVELKEYVNEFLGRVCENNFQKSVQPRFQDLFVVTTTGCAKWKYEDYDNMPKNVVSFSEGDMSYFIGPKGANIKRFNERHEIGKGGIRPLCIARSPFLPVIVTTPFRLNRDQHAAVLSYIQNTHQKIRDDYYYDDGW